LKGLEMENGTFGIFCGHLVFSSSVFGVLCQEKCGNNDRWDRFDESISAVIYRQNYIGSNYKFINRPFAAS
jgi:hypothetical protein